MAALFEVTAQLTKVVDFAIVDDPYRAVLIAHRLVTSDQINDAQPPVPQSNTGTFIEALTVWAAMGQARTHALYDDRLRFRTGHTANTAHPCLLRFLCFNHPMPAQESPQASVD